MKMKLIRIVSIIINFDVPSRNGFLFNYSISFFPILLDEPLNRIFQNLRFFTFRFDDSKTAAKLLCRVQMGSNNDISAVASNSKAIFCPVGGRTGVISPCVENSLLLINVLL